MNGFRVLWVSLVLGAFAACSSQPFVRATRDGGAGADSPKSTASLSDRGAAIVAQRGCPRCHQSPDLGDGILSGQTVPRPGTRAYGANLTPDEETGIGGWSDATILRAIRTGVDDADESLCVMPHFADVSPEEGEQIVAYLRSLVPVHREIPASECDEGDEGDAGPAVH